jgi:Ca2+-binding RTX toxin-like protein
VLGPADVGNSVTCVVRAEAATDAGSSNVASVGPPLNRILPRISGRPRLRQTLSCSRGDWDDIADDRYPVTYRWLRDNVLVAGATTATYPVAAADVNRSIRCRVRAEDLTDATSASVTVRAPTIVIAPTLEGVPRLYRELTCGRGDWDDTAADRYAITYTWLRSNVVIVGATAATYTVQRDDVSRSITCRARAEDLTDATSASTFVDTPTNALRPAIAGQPHMRGELTCSRGAWDDAAASRYAVSYQWYRSGTPINGATSPSYVVGAADLGRSLSCSAIAETLSESFSLSVFVPQPASVISPAIQGIPHPRRELTCSRGEWNDSAGSRYAVSYQWRRNNVSIADADAADYVVTGTDVGTSLSCVVTAEGTRSAISAGVLARWEPLQLTVVPDLDAVTPSSTDVYTVRLSNPNPTTVAISSLELTMPGGFSYRLGTTTGAITTNPTLTGPGALTLRWSGGFTVAAEADAVVRAGVTATAAPGDHFTSARAFPVSSAFTIPATGQTGRVTVEDAAPPAGTCTIVGSEGADVLEGTAGADVICGLGGDDRLRGLSGADQLWGGPGDDRLDGGSGPDTLRGGEGADIVDGGSEGDVLQGGGGLDTLSYALRSAPVTVTLGIGDGDDGAAGEGDTVASDIEIVRGGSGPDVLTGSLGADELYGRGGGDRLEGGRSQGDLLDGGDGADTLVDDDGLVDRLVCGGGIDAFAADILDRVVGCENPIPQGSDG